jgi:hypothetical protein
MIKKTSLPQIKNLSKTKREQIHKLIVWGLIPLVVLVWLVLFVGVLENVSQPGKAPPVLGERISSGLAVFIGQIGQGFRRLAEVVGEAADSTNFAETFYRWRQKLWGRPVISPAESISPVPLPVVSPASLP